MSRLRYHRCNQKILLGGLYEENFDDIIAVSVFWVKGAIFVFNVKIELFGFIFLNGSINEAKSKPNHNIKTSKKTKESAPWWEWFAPISRWVSRQ